MRWRHALCSGGQTGKQRPVPAGRTERERGRHRVVGATGLENGSQTFHTQIRSPFRRRLPAFGTDVSGVGPSCCSCVGLGTRSRLVL